MKFSKEGARERLAEVRKEIADIEAVSGPLREKRDAHVAASRAKEDELNGAIKKAEGDLFDLKNEMAFLARAIGNVGVQAASGSIAARK